MSLGKDLSSFAGNKTFRNGHRFATHIQLRPIPRRSVPYVMVDMSSRNNGIFTPVVGKVDTGAARTMLDFETANAIGIEDPLLNFLWEGTFRTPNNQPLACYGHPVWFRVARQAETPPLVFRVDAGFAKGLRCNLFGLDWTYHFCLAVDRERVHLLRG